MKADGGCVPRRAGPAAARLPSMSAHDPPDAGLSTNGPAPRASNRASTSICQRTTPDGQCRQGRSPRPFQPPPPLPPPQPSTNHHQLALNIYTCRKIARTIFTFFAAWRFFPVGRAFQPAGSGGFPAASSIPATLSRSAPLFSCGSPAQRDEPAQTLRLPSSILAPLLCAPGVCPAPCGRLREKSFFVLVPKSLRSLRSLWQNQRCPRPRTALSVRAESPAYYSLG
jgi:hypothetical protein